MWTGRGEVGGYGWCGSGGEGVGGAARKGVGILRGGWGEGFGWWVRVGSDGEE